MKVVTEEHVVPEKRYTTTKYIASDGMEFSAEQDCLIHEEYLEVINHPVFKTRIADVFTFYDEYSASLYYISNQKDYDFLIKHLGLRNSLYCRDRLIDDYSSYGPGWYLHYCDCGDCSDIHHLYNYDAYEKEQESCFIEWKTNMRNKINSFNNNNSTIV